MSSTLLALPRSRVFTAAGTVLPGAKYYFYTTGTTTAATVYQNATLTTAHSNPVEADVGGLFPAIWLNDTTTYDLTCTDSVGAVQWTVTGINRDSNTIRITSAQTAEPYANAFLSITEPSGAIKGRIGFTSTTLNDMTFTSYEDAALKFRTGDTTTPTTFLERIHAFGTQALTYLGISSNTALGGAYLRFTDQLLTTVKGTVGFTSIADDGMVVANAVTNAAVTVSTAGTGAINLAPAGTVEAVVTASGVHIGASSAAPFIASGTATPEGAITAPIGSTFLRTDGTHAGGTVKYLKTSGSGNTGWVQDCNGGGTTVASVDPLVLPAAGVLFNISGTTNFASITASWVGRIVVLKFEGILTVTDGSNLVMAGNFVTTAGDTLTLVCDGTNWNEMARSVN